MALIKDGNIYRTLEEQVKHLTTKHLEQLNINENVSRDIAEISNAANLGGYNLARFAFEKQGTFYRVANSVITVNLIGNIGDYAEITTGNSNDIPAYGYFTSEHQISISFKGDFVVNQNKFIVNNVSSGQSNEETIQVEAFTGTSLNDYNANENKKQIFNILTDLAYNSRTQYVSFDLNKDGIYNFVFIGAVPNGKDGKSLYSTEGVTVSEIVNKAQLGDSILFAEDNTTSLVDPNAVIGDVYTFEGNGVWMKMGNIRGEQGIKGDTGAQGEQGIQGVQGVQGVKGDKGDKGDKGEPGEQGLILHDGILNNPSELPPFADAKVGDAYTIINTSGTVVAYDLYFKAVDGTTWSILPNWGGIKGDKGDKGDTGEQGIQGIQGIQGPAGPQGPKGDTGATGATGPQGPKGDKGDKGDAGTPGTSTNIYKIVIKTSIVKFSFISSSIILNNNELFMYVSENSSSLILNPAFVDNEEVGIITKVESYGISFSLDIGYNATSLHVNINNNNINELSCSKIN